MKVSRTSSSLAGRLRSIVGGAVLLAGGFLGLALPVLPGWILIIAGLVVLAGAVPPLRRVVSRGVSTAPAQRIVAETAKSDAGRRLMARAMVLPEVRQGLEPAARWHVLRALLRRGRPAHDERQIEP